MQRSSCGHAPALATLSIGGWKRAASDHYSLLAAIPYVRRGACVGIDALVLIADFTGLTLAHALNDPGRRAAILPLYATLFATDALPLAPGLGGLGPGETGRIAFQVLNEPVGFVGLPPDAYVRDVLKPCFAELHDIDSRIIVIAAAESGWSSRWPDARPVPRFGWDTSSAAVTVELNRELELVARAVRAEPTALDVIAGGAADCRCAVVRLRPGAVAAPQRAARPADAQARSARGGARLPGGRLSRPSSDAVRAPSSGPSRCSWDTATPETAAPVSNLVLEPGVELEHARHVVARLGRQPATPARK